jgi:hypothetical protein
MTHIPFSGNRDQSEVDSPWSLFQNRRTGIPTPALAAQAQVRLFHRA